MPPFGNLIKISLVLALDSLSAFARTHPLNYPDLHIFTVYAVKEIGKAI